MVLGGRGCFVLDTGQHRPSCRLDQTWIEGPPRASKYLKLLRPPILRQSLALYCKALIILNNQLFVTVALIQNPSFMDQGWAV
jgi:hypothetical protein